MSLRRVHLVRWLVLGLCLVGLGSRAAVAAPAAANPSAPLAAEFFDGFDTSTLGAGWTWVREDAGQWSLTERAGFMRIHTQAGTLDDASQANNILRRLAPTGDYEVTTRVELTVTQAFHEASLLLYTGDSNFIKISRLYDGGQGGPVFMIRREDGGTGVGTTFSPVLAGTVAELRLRFSAGVVSGAYKDGGGQWVELGHYTLEPLTTTYTHVALAAHHGQPDITPTPITADFDFVQIKPLLTFFLPLISR